MQSYSSNKKRNGTEPRRNESARWSFQTDEMPGSCQSRHKQTQNSYRQSRRDSEVIPSHYMNISGVKLKNTRKDHNSSRNRPSTSKVSHRDYQESPRILKSKNNQDAPYQSYRRSHTPYANVKTTWLDNLRKTKEVRVPPKSFTSRAKRYRKYGDVTDNGSDSAKTSRSSEKNKSSHQIERRRIQSLISSCNWDGSGKPDLYIFGKDLGKGSFGVVKLAHHKITGQKVAIKVYDKSKFKKASQIKRCRQEIDLMSRLNSKKITHLFEAFENSKKIYLVMEALSGGNLCTYVKSKKYLRENEALHIFKQITEGLHFLHEEAGVAHRDIKLENILFTGSKKIKIADFGFSVFVDDNEENVEKMRASGPKLYLKSFCGTPSYMAPEIIKKKGYEGFPVDVWSLGVVFYAMLFGRFPFRARNHDDLYKLILTGRYNLPESLANEVSAEAKSLLKRMIVLDVRKRATIDHLLKASIIQGINYEDSHESKKSKLSLESRSFHLINTNPKDDFKEDLLKQLVRFGFSYHRLRRQIINEERNHITATYYLLRMKQARKKLVR